MQYQATWLEHRIRQMSRRIRPVTWLAFLPVTGAIQSHLTATMFAFICKWPDYGINRDYAVSADATDLK